MSQQSWRTKYTKYNYKSNNEPPTKKRKITTFESDNHDEMHYYKRNNIFLKPNNDGLIDSNKDSIIHYNPNHNKSMYLQRTLLPIYGYRSKILYCVDKYKVTIICGETGSGKSTRMLYVFIY